MAKTYDLAEIIGAQRFGAFQLRIVILCGLVQFLDGFDTQALAYAAPALREAWHLTPPQLGLAFSFGAYGTGIGSVLLSPLAAYALYLPGDAIPTLMLALGLGTLLLSLLGAIGAALTVGLHRGGVLLAILILPLAVPTLLLGTRATDMAATGLDPQGPIYWLCALLALAASLAPFAAAAALRIHLE